MIDEESFVYCVRKCCTLLMWDCGGEGFGASYLSGVGLHTFDLLTIGAGYGHKAIIQTLVMER